MTIQKRVFRMNTMIVLFALISLLCIGGIVIQLFEKIYEENMLRYGKIEKNAYNVQTVLNDIEAEDINDTVFEDISQQLKKYDYRLCVYKNDEITFPDFTYSLDDNINKMADKISYEESSLVYKFEENTFVCRKAVLNGDTYKILAFRSGKEFEWLQVNMNLFGVLILSFIIIGAGAAAVILIISRFFTKMMVNYIMAPVNKLIDGAQRIEEGNLDEPIIYEGAEEFESVCSSFNSMQKSLKEGREKNAAYEKARVDMVAGISHDLRTPLTIIKGYIKGLKDGVADTEEKKMRYLETAYKKSCHMEVLLQKLFYFSKLETGNMPMNKRKTDIGRFVYNTFSEFSKSCEDENIIVSCDEGSEDIYAFIDAEQMTRVINNIIENSVKYSDKDQKVINSGIICTDELIRIEISDNGPGIEESKLCHIFEQFYRGDDSRNTKKEGSGIGLYICKYIIESHDGRIYAENNETGEGLKIVIELPKA